MRLRGLSLQRHALLALTPRLDLLPRFNKSYELGQYPSRRRLFVDLASIRKKMEEPDKRKKKEASNPGS
jgi:hypothetical protein